MCRSEDFSIIFKTINPQNEEDRTLNGLQVIIKIDGIKASLLTIKGHKSLFAVALLIAQLIYPLDLENTEKL